MAIRADKTKPQKPTTNMIWSYRELKILRAMAVMGMHIQIQFIIETIWPNRKERPANVLKLATQQMIRLRVKMRMERIPCEKIGDAEDSIYEVSYKLRDYVQQHLTPYIRPRNKIRRNRLKEVLKRQS